MATVGRIVLPLAALYGHVRRQRLLLDLTQTELAAEAGVSQSLIAKLERGRLNPSYESVRHILQALERHGRHQEATAADLMHADPLFCRPGEKVGAVLTRMKENGISQVPVLDRRRPVGQVTESGILGRIERGANIDDIRRMLVRDLMNTPMPMVASATRRAVLVEMLKDEPAVLVVEGGEVLGVVTKSDLW